MPAGATGLSFGLDLGSVGTLTTSDYRFQKAPIKAGVLAFRTGLLVAVCAIAARIIYTRRALIARAVARADPARLHRRERRPREGWPAASEEPVAGLPATTVARGARMDDVRRARDRPDTR